MEPTPALWGEVEGLCLLWMPLKRTVPNSPGQKCGVIISQNNSETQRVERPQWTIGPNNPERNSLPLLTEIWSYPGEGALSEGMKM